MSEETNTDSQASDSESQGGIPPQLVDRRDFFLVGLGVMGGILGVVAATPMIGSFLTPLFKERKGAQKVPTMKAEDLPEGKPFEASFEINIQQNWMKPSKAKRSVWLLKKDGKVRAYHPSCTHLGCGYSYDDKENQFFCPCHGGVFNLEGEVTGGPPLRELDYYEVETDANGMVMLDTEKKLGNPV